MWTRIDYEIPYFDDIIVVSGHTPTQNILGNSRPGYIFKENHHIAIDCGAGKAMEDWRQSVWIPGKNIMHGKCCKERNREEYENEL